MARILFLRIMGLLCGVVFLVTCGEDAVGPSTATVVSVLISPSVDTITAIDATVPLGAVALDGDGDTLSGKSFTWTSSEEYIVAVQSGVAKAISPGHATITVTSEGRSASCVIWVIQEVDSVAVWMDEQHAYVLELGMFAFPEPFDANGHWIPDLHFTWSSSDDAVATVTGNEWGGGVVTPKGDGTAMITASADGAQGSTTLQVTAAVQLLWEYQTQGEPTSPIALGTDGTIYFGSTDHRLYALNPDGTMKWGHLTGGYIWSSPAVSADGTIYVGSEDYRLYAVSPDGTGQWEFMTGGMIYSSPAIASDGTVYVGSSDSRLYAVNPDGTYKWDFLTGGHVYSSPAIALDGTVYVGSLDGRLYAINPDGTEKWDYLIGGEILASPAIADDGTIYITSQDSRVHAVNPDGTAKWSYLAGSYPISSSPVIAPDGTIYVGGGEDEFLAFNPDGSLKWEYAMEYSDMWSLAAVAADGTIYVDFIGDPFTALDPNGTLLWSARMGWGSVSSPAIAPDGTVYTASEEGRLYAVVPIAGAATNGGLADSAWPRVGHDAQSTRNAGTR